MPGRPEMRSRDEYLQALNDEGAKAKEGLDDQHELGQVEYLLAAAADTVQITPGGQLEPDQVTGLSTRADGQSAAEGHRPSWSKGGGKPPPADPEWRQLPPRRRPTKGPLESRNWLDRHRDGWNPGHTGIRPTARRADSQTPRRASCGDSAIPPRAGIADHWRMATPRHLLVDPANECDSTSCSRCVRRAFLWRRRRVRPARLLPPPRLARGAPQADRAVLRGRRVRLTSTWCCATTRSPTGAGPTRRWRGAGSEAFPPTERGEVVEALKPERRELILDDPGHVARARCTLGLDVA